MDPPAAGITVLLSSGTDVAGVGLRALLGADPRITLVGELRGDVLHQAQRYRPDVIVLDPADGDRLNVALVAALAERVPQSRICIDTNCLEPRTVLDVLQAGARAYLLKAGADGAFVVETIAHLGRFGATGIDPTVWARLDADRSHRLRLRLIPQGSVQQPLSAREQAVLMLLAQGQSDKGIAARLGIKNTTVRRYVERARTKLGAATREQLMVRAVQQGLLEG
jgi:DNA-binding NarL/FixJ family response regulator